MQKLYKMMSPKFRLMQATSVRNTVLFLGRTMKKEHQFQRDRRFTIENLLSRCILPIEIKQAQKDISSQKDTSQRETLPSFFIR